MRVLMLSWEYPPHIVGGLGAHVAALAPALVRAGAEVRLVTPRAAGGEAVEAIASGAKRGSRKRAGEGAVYRIDPTSSTGSFYGDVRQTNLTLEQQGLRLFEECGPFDVIHAHDWLVASAAIALKHAHKTPLLATIHATERGRGRGNLAGEAARAINDTEWRLTYESWRVVCTSRFMAEEVKGFFQVPSDKIDVVANGVDCAPFDALDGTDLASFRARWANPKERIVFSVGRVVEEKGPQVLVEAAPRVLAEIAKTKIIVAGTGGMVDLLKRRVWELGLADQVVIAGFISDEDRDRLLKVADVAVFPSLYEPFGIVALEAMAARCPVVVSAVGGLVEVVQHGETGITVRANDADSLAWGILHTLRHPAWSRERAENAYHVVKEEYNWDRIAARTVEVYGRIVNERANTVW